MTRRLIYFLIVFIWLVLMSLPVMAFVLATQGEIMLGSDDGSNLRLFMINEDAAEGVGMQRVKRAGTDRQCLQTSVRYYLWKGQDNAFSTDFCTCFDSDTGYAEASAGCEER